MPQTNTGKIVLELKDAYGKLISDTLELRFRNLRVQSFDFLKKLTLKGAPVTLEGVPAFPNGNWKVEVFPTKYRFKSVFVDLPSNGKVSIRETFFVASGKVKAVLPTLDAIQNDKRWSVLGAVLKTSPVAYDGLDDNQKAGLLNLFAKMSHGSTGNVFREVTSIFEVKPARIYAEVGAKLWENVRAEPQRFHEEPDNGSMHKFGGGWTRLKDHASFKTPDPMGNLQLTFARNARKAMAVDADLDDHRGLQHAFDVIKHKFSGDTNPYDIHDVLVKFQGIDPGYHFS